MKGFIIFNSVCIALISAYIIWLYKHGAPEGIRLFFLLCLVVFILNFIRMSKDIYNLKKKDAEIKALKKERDDLLDDQDDIYAN
jgi:hypothetical protein